ncbi:MAG: TraR/DksA C4-type zinc finger protein [Oligoflexia bacterium]|nr:TraR/DksA C4-type zinc finger protein [Oligoflexia bacterium]MBF0364783.1 TraR/DksA C4-type zinc finger protein [Oligoflexia bacterium]
MVKQEIAGYSGLSTDQVGVLRNLLMRKKNELLFKHRNVDEFNLTVEDRSDEIDLANADAVNAQQLRFRNRDNFYEKKIDEALTRIENEEYGLCEECSNPIGYLRLFARPTANLCIFCKEEAERDEANNGKSRVRGRMLSYLSTFSNVK